MTHFIFQMFATNFIQYSLSSYLVQGKIERFKKIVGLEFSFIC